MRQTLHMVALTVFYFVILFYWLDQFVTCIFLLVEAVLLNQFDCCAQVVACIFLLVCSTTFGGDNATYIRNTFTTYFNRYTCLAAC